MSSPLPLLFCPQCETLLLAEPTCPTCRWQRPAPTDRPGQPVGPPLKLAGHLPSRPSGLTAAPVVAGDLLLIGLQELTPERAGVLLALDATTRHERWRHTLPSGKMCRFPVVSGDRVLIGYEDLQILAAAPAELRALDAATGALLWPHAAPVHSLSAPAVLPPDGNADGIVFTVGNDGRGFALQHATGDLLWTIAGLKWGAEPPAAAATGFFAHSAAGQLLHIDRRGRPTPLLDLPADSPFPRSSAVDADTLYLTVGPSYCQIWAVDLATGRVRWANTEARAVTTPALVGPLLYVGVKEIPKRSYAVWALDRASGAQRGRYPSQRHFYAPLALDGDHLYAAIEDEGVVALDLLTLAEQWHAPLETADGLRATPLVAGHTVSVLARGGALFTLATRVAPPQDAFEPAAVYAARGDWETAVMAAALHDDFRAAGDAAARLERWFHAGQLYERAGAWRAAGEAYLHAPRYRHAARAFVAAGLHEAAGDALRQGGHLLQAAELFAGAQLPSRAADAYLAAGRPADAAGQFALAGAIERAVALYIELRQPAPAVALLEQDRQIERAAALLLAEGQTQASADLLERHNRHKEAAALLEDAQQIEQAAALLDRRGLSRETAELWRRNRRWDLAAQRFDDLGDYQLAAELYEKAGQIDRAARLYRDLGDTQRAVALYKHLKLAAELAEIYTQMGEWGKAAGYHLQSEPPNHAAAATCFERAAMWTEAARSYETAADWEPAARCWQKSSTPRRAADLLAEQLRRPLEAAELLRALGALPAAVELLARHNRLKEAAALYSEAGQSERAWQLLRERRAWELLRHLAAEQKADAVHAEACEQLLRNTDGRATRARYHREAAAALARVARSAEQAGLNADDVAAHWEAAAGHFDDSDDRSDAAACRQELIRLRRLPDLHLTVSAPSELVEGQWSTLVVTAVNRGYGDAWYLSVRVDSDEFEGDLNRTQHLGSLRPGAETQLPVSVRPRPDRVGDAVPVELLFNYLLGDDDEVQRAVRTPVRVVGKAEHADARRSGREAQRPSQIVNIYTDKEVKTYAGDDYSQVGDRVEVNSRTTGRRTVLHTDEPPTAEGSFADGGAPGAPCPACGHPTTTGQAFCRECGAPLPPPTTAP